MDAKPQPARFPVSRPDIAVIGAGVAGLTAAALLARAGATVQVLERHTVAGGCASFYQREGFRFDVGATLVGGFGERGVHRAVFDHLGVELRARAVEPAMVVHLPDDRVARYGDARWETERRRAFGLEAEPFWLAQERYADLAWDFSTRFPALPADPSGLAALVGAFRPRHLALLGTLGRRVSSILGPAPSRKLSAFVDAQLLITAQSGAHEADLAYGSTALDLAREGTFHLPGGVGSIATALARSVRRAGGGIAYGTQAAGIETARGRVRAVRLEGGAALSCGAVVAAIPASATLALLGSGSETVRLARLTARTAAFPQRWGAFVVYAGLPPGVVPAELALHHQLVLAYGRPAGEGNTVFLSFSAPGELQRARGGGRAVTISTHTDVALWERAARDGTVERLRERYGRALLAALDRVVPGATARAQTVEFATPATFARYTGRPRGLVGGVPQTPAFAGLRAASHASGISGLVLCGDTIFPGQSTVGASLSGVAAARALFHGLNLRR